MKSFILHLVILLSFIINGHTMNYRGRILALFSAVIVSCAIQAMDNDFRKNRRETETRMDRTKEDMIQSMIANSYLSDSAEIDFASLDRVSVLMQLRETMDIMDTALYEKTKPNPTAFDNHIALFNKISVHDKKIRVDVEAKNKRSFFSSVWDSLPFVRKPQPLSGSTAQLPIEQQRILFELLKKDSDTAMPAAEKIKAFFGAHLNKNDHTAEITNYVWDGRANLELPATFCNGLVKFNITGNTPFDMSPRPDEAILPATQYWREDDAKQTRMSDDTAHTDVNMPGHYSLFDASQSHFVGVGLENTIQIFELPRRARKYEIYTSKENDIVEVKNIVVKPAVKHTIEKPIFTKKGNNVSALLACQQTQEIVYSESRDKNSVVFVQKIKNFATLPPLSIDVEGSIDHIVQLDCFNFICLTRDGSLHRVTKKFDNRANKAFLKAKKLKSSIPFSYIAIDSKTNLCSVTQAGIDHKDALYVIDKNILKESNRINNNDLQKIETKNPFEKGLEQYEDPHHEEDEPVMNELRVDGECFSTSRRIAPILQCYNGTVIAWYPRVITMSGYASRYGNRLLMTELGNYSAIRAFKTNFQ